MVPTDSDLCKTRIYSYLHTQFFSGTWRQNRLSASSDHPWLPPTSINAVEDPQQHEGSVRFMCAQKAEFQTINAINVWVFLHLQGNNISINTGSVYHSWGNFNAA